MVVFSISWQDFVALLAFVRDAWSHADRLGRRRKGVVASKSNGCTTVATVVSFQNKNYVSFGFYPVATPESMSEEEEKKTEAEKLKSLKALLLFFCRRYAFHVSQQN